MHGQNLWCVLSYLWDWKWNRPGKIMLCISNLVELLSYNTHVWQLFLETHFCIFCSIPCLKVIHITLQLVVNIQVPRMHCGSVTCLNKYLMKNYMWYQGPGRGWRLALIITPDPFHKEIESSWSKSCAYEYCFYMDNDHIGNCCFSKIPILISYGMGPCWRIP